MHKRGIAEDKYLELMNMQNYKCAICSKEETHLGRSGEVIPLAVDHCHKTGVVRGLLCTHCNLALGQLKDNSITLRRAALYLEKEGNI